MLRLKACGYLFYAIATASPLWAEPKVVPVCIVQTKPDQATQYDPAAGPWAIEMNDQLDGKMLSNGSSLKTTVLAASIQKDILPEAKRLHCAWVAQLWLHDSVDLGPTGMGVSANGPRPAVNPRRADQSGSESNLFFSLWNVETRKVVASGSNTVRISAVERSEASGYRPCAAFAQQALKRLGELP
jgi:hypothetical protein